MAVKRSRVKPDLMVYVKSLDDANAALGEIAGIKRRIEAAEAEMNDKIDQIKAETAAKIEPLANRLKALENGLLAYSEFNRDELFKKKKSIELAFGLLGYRKSTMVKPLPRKKWADVLERLDEMNFQEAVLVKKRPNKDVLRQWSDERLELVYARKVSKETFWYEVKEEEVKAA